MTQSFQNAHSSHCVETGTERGQVEGGQVIFQTDFFLLDTQNPIVHHHFWCSPTPALDKAVVFILYLKCPKYTDSVCRSPQASSCSVEPTCEVGSLSSDFCPHIVSAEPLSRADGEEENLLTPNFPLTRKAASGSARLILRFG